MSEFSETINNQKAKLTTVGTGRFGAKLAVFPDGTKACVKKQVFDNKPFRGIERDSFPAREVMAYRFDRDVMNFGIVPETLLMKIEEKDQASIQKWVNGEVAGDIVPHVFNTKRTDWKEKVSKLASLLPLDEVHKLIVFDLVIGGRDRHSKNAIFDLDNEKAWAIDNGCAFGTRGFSLYRNVFHKYLFLHSFKLNDECGEALKRVTRQACHDVLVFLEPAERDACFARANYVLSNRKRLDFATISRGRLENNEFPTHNKWFRRFWHKDGDLPLVVPV